MKNLLVAALFIACTLTMTVGCSGDTVKTPSKPSDAAKDAPAKDKMMTPPGKVPPG